MNKRPFQYLPVQHPKDFDPGPDFFYKNIAHPLIDDVIKIMNTGLHIDPIAVENLRKTVEDVLTKAEKTLAKNPIIHQFQKEQQKVNQKIYEAKCIQSVRTSEYYFKEYNESIEHRTWVINKYLNSINCKDEIKNKWTIKDLKHFNIYKEDSFIQSIIDKTYAVKCPIINASMQSLAEYKAELWNRPRYGKSRIQVDLEPFNPSSNKQICNLFKMLDIEAYETSTKTGQPSWQRKHIEQLKKELHEDDVDLHELLDCIIDVSFGSIIKSNFINAFDKFSIDGVLHGNIRIFGAKSFRPTSNSP